jgi:hypothetical protein
VSLHQLGRYGVGWLLDILRSYPGELTTVIPRSTIDHLTPGINTSRYIGLHYDQQILRPDGWAERLPMGKRLQAGRRIVVNVGIGRRVAVTALNFLRFSLLECSRRTTLDICRVQMISFARCARARTC